MLHDLIVRTFKRGRWDLAGKGLQQVLKDLDMSPSRAAAVKKSLRDSFVRRSSSPLIVKDLLQRWDDKAAYWQAKRPNCTEEFPLSPGEDNLRATFTLRESEAREQARLVICSTNQKLGPGGSCRTTAWELLCLGYNHLQHLILKAHTRAHKDGQNNVSDRCELYRREAGRQGIQFMEASEPPKSSNAGETDDEIGLG